MFNGILFQESLQDLVKGIRANRRNETEYMRKRVSDVGDECRTFDMEKKAVAVLKLAYLQMMGYNISFSSFYITEVMSSPNFATKRIGYLAAAQSFSPCTDVLLLTTNQFKKDLTNGKVQDCSQALTCLGKLVTEELGRDLENDVAMLLNSPRPYIRKKCLLVLYRLILVHPDTMSVVSPKFREMLGDSDPSVVCAAVTVICELAKVNPTHFLALAPIFYQLLTSPTSNNWMLIKIVKLMGVLTPQEPRLARKLVEPLVSLMRSTRAKSLLYECCSTVTSGLLAHSEAVELCAHHLSKFMVDPDQNLKYLGLLSMRKLIRVHPDVAMEHRDLVLDCLDDDDVGIRMRSLEIVAEFLNTRNCRDLCRILLKKLKIYCNDNVINATSIDPFFTAGQPQFSQVSQQLGENYGIDEEGPFRDSLADQLLRPGKYCRDVREDGVSGYEMLSTTDDFLWYFGTVLNGLATTNHLSDRVYTAVADQILELTSRVAAVRQTSVEVALSLFKASADRHDSDASVNTAGDEIDLLVEQKSSNCSPELGSASLESSEIRRSLHLSLVSSASWVIGEFGELVSDHLDALRTLVDFDLARSCHSVSFTSTILKIYALCSNSCDEDMLRLVKTYMDMKCASESAEVQDGAWLFQHLLSSDADTGKNEVQSVFEGKLKPVDFRVQSMIPLPDRLGLDESLVDIKDRSLTHYLRSLSSNVEDDGTVLSRVAESYRSGVSNGKYARKSSSSFILSVAESKQADVSSDKDTRRIDQAASVVDDEKPVGIDLGQVPLKRNQPSRGKPGQRKKKVKGKRKVRKAKERLIDVETHVQNVECGTPKLIDDRNVLL